MRHTTKQAMQLRASVPWVMLRQSQYSMTVRDAVMVNAS
jgi:hypothetical protein